MSVTRIVFGSGGGLMDVQQYIAEYKSWFYLITVCWTFLEGETFVLLAAAFAANGSLDPYKLGACAWLGSYLGDQSWFFLGRRFGHVLLRWRPEWKHGIDMVHRWLDRWDVLFILSFRFIYGIRNFSSAAMGLSELSATRFMSLNFIAAGIWAVVFVSIGYASGHAMVRVLGAWAQTIELTLLGIFGLFLVGALAMSWLRGHRKRQKAHAILRESLEEERLN